MNALTKKRTRGNQEDSAHEKPYPKEKRNVSIKVQNPIPIVIGIKQKRLKKKKKEKKRGGVEKMDFALIDSLSTSSYSSISPVNIDFSIDGPSRLSEYPYLLKKKNVKEGKK